MSEPSPTCEVATGDWARDGRWAPACGQPSAVVLTIGCIHEHIDQPAACAGCVAKVQIEAHLLICRRCEESPVPHNCKLSIHVDRLDAAGSASRPYGVAGD